MTENENILPPTEEVMKISKSSENEIARLLAEIFRKNHERNLDAEREARRERLRSFYEDYD